MILTEFGSSISRQYDVTGADPVGGVQRRVSEFGVRDDNEGVGGAVGGA